MASIIDNGGGRNPERKTRWMTRTFLSCAAGRAITARFVSIKNGYPKRRPGADGRDTTVSRITRAMVLDYDILKEKYGVSLDTSVGVSISDAEGGDDYATAVAPVSELFRAAEEGKNHVPF